MDPVKRLSFHAFLVEDESRHCWMTLLWKLSLPFHPTCLWGMDVCDGWGCNSHVEATKKRLEESQRLSPDFLDSH